MNDRDFRKLLLSIKQMGMIRRGEMKPSRVFEYKPANVRAIRKKLHVTQREFAALIGVSVGTLRNWEQGRRMPDGPARALLRVAEADPKAVVAALS